LFVNSEIVASPGAESFLDDLVSKGTDLSPIYKAWVEMRRELVEKEFTGSFWLSPGGKSVPWKPVNSFGTQPAPSSPLKRSGALLNAFLGKGAGGIERITKSSVSLGVSGSVFPQAAVHRGGAGEIKQSDANTPLRITVTPKMRGFLAANFKVFLKKSTEVITIPRRPFFTDSPLATTRLSGILSRYVLGLEPLNKKT